MNTQPSAPTWSPATDAPSASPLQVTPCAIVSAPLGTVYVPEYISCRFTPQPDITAYELALLLPYLTGRYGYGITRDDYNKMGSEKRHLEVTS